MYALIADAVKSRRFPFYERLSQQGDRLGLINGLKARHLATHNKRLDICAGQFAQLLHFAETGGLEGKTCLEIGSGWVLSHALVCHLLGAERVIATDIFPMAHYARLTEAVQRSVAYFIRDSLTPFSDYERVMARLDRLLAIRQFSEKTLRELGVEYHAPFDFSQRAYDEPIDFVWSFACLSHIPAPLVEPIAENLYGSLRPGGWMAHAIHLEDTRSFEKAPFAFYALPEAQYPVAYHSIRGNRLRASHWESLFNRLAPGRTRVLFSWMRDAQLLPATIDASVRYTSQEDLRTSHLGIMATR